MPAKNQKTETPYGLERDGGWVDAMLEVMAHSQPDQRQHWEKLLQLAAEATPRTGGDWLEVQQLSEAKCGYPTSEYAVDEPPHPAPGSDAYQARLLEAAPDEAWLERVRSLSQALGERRFALGMAKVYRSALQSGIGSLNRNTPNRERLRALIWCVLAVPAPEMIQALTQLTIWSIEHKAAQAATASLALASTSTDHAAAALRMVETAAKRPSPKTRFGRLASHVEQKAGIKPEDSAERFVPTFGLDNRGSCKKPWGDRVVAELAIEDSKAGLHFYNAVGKPLASLPVAVKRKYAAELKELRAAAKGLDQLLATQKIRLESLMLVPRSWKFNAWSERYLNHPVVGNLARRLIWTFDGHAGICTHNVISDIRGDALHPDKDAEVRLWHPLDKSADEVMRWREQLELLNLRQPFKQAHRELYLLTDAERQSDTYSNRFASHILRQPQLRALATARQWTAPFLGAWDGGAGDPVKRSLPDGWRAEFWVNAIGDQHSESGGLLHVSTDQVRFYHADRREPSRLSEVPGLIFSEAMRDVDLFVGVASVGNDPDWRDGGPNHQHRDYWTSMAFGELNASAKVRRDVLSRFLLKLKIADACTLADRYLVVHGQKRVYKIHLGSGNIIMEPNGQYLCIVPDRRMVADDHGCFLPFEGDTMLSIILSKAFLLAEDSKITDPTITRQIDGTH